MRLTAGVVALPLCALAWLIACSNPPPVITCTDIPTGGCPQDNGADVCGGDVTCDAVYDCSSKGTWVLDHKCPPRPDAGRGDAGADAPEANAVDTGTIDVDIDAPPGAYGGPGCTDLQMPDCSLGVGIGCAGTPDCCGCEDLWVCQNGGWVLWGSCVDGGPMGK